MNVLNLQTNLIFQTFTYECGFYQVSTLFLRYLQNDILKENVLSIKSIVRIKRTPT